MEQASSQRTMMKQSIHIYLYTDNMVIEGTRSGCRSFADGDAPNSIVTHNFGLEHRLIVVDPNRPRHFRLETINQEQLLTLNDT